MLPLIINNESVITDNVVEVHNPATGELLHRCAGASVDDANRAVAAAKAAFPIWSKTHPYERRAILSKAADIMFSRKEEFIKTQMEETGAGRMFVEVTFMASVSFLRDFAGMIPSVEGRAPIVAEEGQSALVIKQPYGVVLGIAPWYVCFFWKEAVSLTNVRLQERSFYPRNSFSRSPFGRWKHNDPQRLRVVSEMFLVDRGCSPGSWTSRRLLERDLSQDLRCARGHQCAYCPPRRAQD